MAKSSQAFRTIREVADWLGVAAHVLRFWESKFPQIKPVKRAGGRRYYRPSDMALVGGIKVLLHDQGLTIRGVQKMIRADGVDAVAAMAPPFTDFLDETGVIDSEAEAWTQDAAADAASEPKQKAKKAAPVATLFDDDDADAQPDLPWGVVEPATDTTPEVEEDVAAEPEADEPEVAAPDPVSSDTPPTPTAEAIPEPVPLDLPPGATALDQLAALAHLAGPSGAIEADMLRKACAELADVHARLSHVTEA